MRNEPVVEQMTTTSVDAASGSASRRGQQHPLLRLVTGRVLAGVAILFVVSLLVFFATQILPGNAATAVLGHSATPDRVHALEQQLHLNRGVVDQYWLWLSGLLTGDPGQSLASGTSVWGQVEPRLLNSAALVVIAGLLGSILGVALGVVAALKKDGWFDHGSAVAALTIAAVRSL